jgi:hypothetical protein
MRGKAGRLSPRQFNVAAVSGLSAWWDASDSSTLFDAQSAGSNSAADQEVGRLEDKSGNGRHFTQSTSANRPIRKTSQQSGRDVLRFNGTSASMITAVSFSDFFSATASTAFVVAKAQSVNTNSNSVGQNASVLSEISGSHSFVMLRSNDTAASFGYVTQHVTTSLSYVPGSWKVFTTTHDGTNLSFAINGGAPSQASLGTRTFMNSLLRLGVNGNPSVFFEGDVGEVITFNVALSSSDRSDVEQYLIAKWGLT